MVKEIPRWPRELVAGVLLVALAWPLAWFGPSWLSEYTFFPLWLGYILTVDGVTRRRSGTSLLTRDKRQFGMLFAFSLPLWWLFEFANNYLMNWRYVEARHYQTLTYVVLASLAFSTVMPAILATAELYRTFAFFARSRQWVPFKPSRAGMIAVGALGLLLFAGSLTFPKFMFGFAWIGLFLFIDVVNALTGGASIAEQVGGGRWDTVLTLFAAGITCGVFWEMWNYWSLPKWIYTVPYASHPKLFEMPLLGYGGYLPFALEVYAVYHLLHTLLTRRRDGYLRLDAAADRD